MTDVSELKRQAAEFAVEQFVESGMLLGLGFGSTAAYAVRRIGEKIASGDLRSITAVACAKATETLAEELGIPLIGFAPETLIDVTIDGADEVDGRLNMIKGGGGALTREKFIAQLSRRHVIIADGSKVVKMLGATFPVPIEVIPFGYEAQIGFLTGLGAEPKLRHDKNNSPFRTDQDNYIIDADFGPLENAYALADQLNRRAGIVEHGLFLDIATDLVVATEDGISHRINET